MKLSQNDLEYLKDMIQQGKLAADEANIQKVLMQRVMVVTSLPMSIRKNLNSAVKKGILGHMKKDGNKPEVYFNPTFDYLARAERNKHERNILNALLKVCV